MSTRSSPGCSARAEGISPRLRAPIRRGDPPPHPPEVFLPRRKTCFVSQGVGRRYSALDPRTGHPAQPPVDGLERDARPPERQGDDQPDRHRTGAPGGQGAVECRPVAKPVAREHGRQEARRGDRLAEIAERRVRRCKDGHDDAGHRRDRHCQRPAPERLSARRSARPGTRLPLVTREAPDHASENCRALHAFTLSRAAKHATPRRADNDDKDQTP